MKKTHSDATNTCMDTITNARTYIYTYNHNAPSLVEGESCTVRHTLLTDEPDTLATPLVDFPVAMLSLTDL